MNELLLNKSLIWAAQNKQRDRMWPAGHQFDMPVLDRLPFKVRIVSSRTRTPAFFKRP